MCLLRHANISSSAFSGKANRGFRALLIYRFMFIYLLRMKNRIMKYNTINDYDKFDLCTPDSDLLREFFFFFSKFWDVKIWFTMISIQ